MEWYHYTLLHPGRDRTLMTINQHLYWKGLKNDVKQFVRHCPTCQHTKRTHKKYGYVPPKEAEAVPWQQRCVDLIGPYKIHINSPNKTWKNKKFDQLWCVTMIDPATSWCEVVEIFNKTPMEIANIVEMT